MPSIGRLSGMDELKRNSEKFGINMYVILEAAEDAAAIVMRDAIRAAAPRGSGERVRPGWKRIRDSIMISKPSTKELTGGARAFVRVGPSRAAPHAYWHEFGWTFKNGKYVSGSRWMTMAIEGAQEAAYRAGEAAAQAKAKELEGSGVHA